MAVQRIGGEDNAGNAALTVIGPVFTIPAGRRLNLSDFSLSSVARTVGRLELSTDGGTTFNVIQDWELASPGYLSDSYETPILSDVGVGTDRQVRLRYQQLAGIGRVTFTMQGSLL